eukprot:7091037-Prymnesium_polylepis.1
MQNAADGREGGSIGGSLAERARSTSGVGGGLKAPAAKGSADAGSGNHRSSGSHRKSARPPYR